MYLTWLITLSFKSKDFYNKAWNCKKKGLYYINDFLLEEEWVLDNIINEVLEIDTRSIPIYNSNDIQNIYILNRLKKSLETIAKYSNEYLDKIKYIKTLDPVNEKKKIILELKLANELTKEIKRETDDCKNLFQRLQLQNINKEIYNKMKRLLFT